MRLRNIKNADEIISSSNYFLQEQDIASFVLTINKPIHLEIGCGKGDFIIGLAKQNKDIYFFGIEKSSTVLTFVTKKLEQLQLPNLMIINIDASFICDYFKKETISIIYLNFSDPWPKKRHIKNRLTAQSFLEKYNIILKKDGHIHQKTDNRLLFEFSLTSLNNFGFVFDNVYLDLHKTDIFNILTEYERKFSAFGPIYKIEASKRREL